MVVSNKKEIVVKDDKNKVFDVNKDVFFVIRRPRVTEKSVINSERGVYVFEVSERANKNQIKEAVKHLYKVTPEKVGISRIPEKRTVRRGVKGVKSGAKKAFVYLKKGDKIELA